MKHLKRFNESVEDVKRQELQEFCESYLAYLIDKGFKVDISKFGLDHETGYFQEIKFTYDNNYFLWDRTEEGDSYNRSHNISNRIKEVKDDFIPFLQMLDNKYYFDYLLITDAFSKIHRIYIRGDDKGLDFDILEKKQLPSNDSLNVIKLMKEIQIVVKIR